MQILKRWIRRWSKPITAITATSGWRLESVYGEGNTYVFISMRQDYADADKGSTAFFAALSKAYGQDSAQKMLREWDSCLLSSRSELRKRRWDLSRKVPAAADYARFVGESRMLRTTAVHIRPGHVADFEALLKDRQNCW